MKIVSIILLMLAISGLVLAPPGPQPKTINQCTEIKQPGDYVLTADLNGAPIPVFGGHSCILISSSNVNLDCDGHILTGPGVVFLADRGLVSEDGIVVPETSDHTTIKNCKVTGYSDGVHSLSNSNLLITNAFYQNLFTGGYIQGDDNKLLYNAAFNNGGQINLFGIVPVGEGFYINNGVRNQISLNKVYDNLVDGFLIADEDKVTISSNDAYLNGINYDLTNNNKNVLFTGNKAHDATGEDGIKIDLIESAIFSQNEVYNNFNGISIQNHKDILFLNNRIKDNAKTGLRVSYTTNAFRPSNIITSSNEFSGNNIGVYIYALNILSSKGHDSISMGSDHFYNNKLVDFDVEKDDMTATKFNGTSENLRLIVDLSKVVFDNPNGDYKDDTVLSMHHELLNGDASQDYSISWSNKFAPLPALQRSFAQKFIAIEPWVGKPVINSITWNWDNAEVQNGNYDENWFYIAKYTNFNGNWADIGATLDTTVNTLTKTNLFIDKFGVYGILENKPQFGACTNGFGC